VYEAASIITPITPNHLVRSIFIEPEIVLVLSRLDAQHVGGDTNAAVHHIRRGWQHFR
jgi:hypothetical protein